MSYQDRKALKELYSSLPESPREIIKAAAQNTYTTLEAKMLTIVRRLNALKAFVAEYGMTDITTNEVDRLIAQVMRIGASKTAKLISISSNKFYFYI